MDRNSLNRRMLVKLMASAGISGVAFAPHRALADTSTQSFGETLEQAVQFSEEMRGLLNSQESFDFSRNTVKRFQFLDYRGRFDMALAAHCQGREAVIEKFLDSSPGSQADLAHIIETSREFGIPLIPAPYEVLPFPAHRLYQGAESDKSTARLTPAMFQAENEANCPEISVVITHIILDALGLLDIKEILIRVLQEIDFFAGQNENIETIIDPELTPEQVVDAVGNLVQLLLGKTVWQELVKRMSEEARQKFLKAISVRMIPWVGWGILLGCLALTVYDYWPALRRAVNCDRNPPAT